MPRRAKEVEAGLLQKGFQLRQSKDAYFHLWHEGKKTAIWTKISHGEREIHDGLLAAMSRQVKLSRRQFDDLVDCPLSKEEYISLLKESGDL